MRFKDDLHNVIEMEANWGKNVEEVWTWRNCGQKIMRLKERSNFGGAIHLIRYTLGENGVFTDELAGERRLDSAGDLRQTQYLYSILTYYSEANLIPLAGNLIKFNQLEGGMAKAKFSDEVERKLKSLFDQDQALVGALFREIFHARDETYGDLSFSIEFLPHLPVYFVYHEADEEDGFDSECKIFFDETANHYLPTEICDYLVDIFVTRLENELSKTLSS